MLFIHLQAGQYVTLFADRIYCPLIYCLFSCIHDIDAMHLSFWLNKLEYGYVSVYCVCIGVYILCMAIRSN